MARVGEFEFPDDLWFDVELDVWARQREDKSIVLGMTDPAQARAGRILHVRARTGKSVEAGKSTATIESGKWVGPFPAPLKGTVLELNPLAAADPNLINRDPYGEGWIVRLQPSLPDWPQGNLLNGPEVAKRYEVKLTEEGFSCMLPPGGKKEDQ
ncbi:glycine cleavage system protein H [Ferviditalea candida]|uniref:Glycine cleavage system protein H n=1 Tax=Ferviditalea candida TaxID=3108399 RepID=A0ABU5ZNU1_9BACL|nr:glycine cleavage system protein H [Paenibacillaceae bacterium T2]